MILNPYYAPIAHVEPLTRAGQPYLRKRRFWHVEALIALTNRSGHLPFITLPQAQWFDWEEKCYRWFYNRPVYVEGNAICLPRLPGELLPQLLQTGQRWAALSAAIQALYQCHQLSVASPHAAEADAYSFSHADATARNFLYDPATETASWFDFETIHPPQLTSLQRHVDDLRTFTYSAAGLLPPDELGQFARLLSENYPDSEALCGLSRLAQKLERSPSRPHLGQTRLSREQNTSWSAAVQRALN